MTHLENTCHPKKVAKEEAFILPHEEKLISKINTSSLLEINVKICKILF